MLRRLWLSVALAALSLTATAEAEAQTLRRNGASQGQQSGRSSAARSTGRSSRNSQIRSSQRRSTPTRARRAPQQRVQPRSRVQRSTPQPRRATAPTVRRNSGVSRRATTPRAQSGFQRGTIQRSNSQRNSIQRNSSRGNSSQRNSIQRNSMQRNSMPRNGSSGNTIGGKTFRRGSATRRNSTRAVPNRLQRDPNPARTAVQASRATGQRRPFGAQPTGIPRTIRPALPNQWNGSRQQTTRGQTYDQLIRNRFQGNVTGRTPINAAGRSALNSVGRTPTNATGATPFGAVGRTPANTNNGFSSANANALRRQAQAGTGVSQLRGNVTGAIKVPIVEPLANVRRGSISGIRLDRSRRGSITGQSVADPNRRGGIVDARPRSATGRAVTSADVNALRTTADVQAIGGTVGASPTAERSILTPSLGVPGGSGRVGLSVGSVVTNPATSFYPYGSYYSGFHGGHYGYGHYHHFPYSHYYYPYYRYSRHCHWLWSSYHCHSIWSPYYLYGYYRYGRGSYYGRYGYRYGYYNDCDNDYGTTTNVYVEVQPQDDDRDDVVAGDNAFSDVELAFCQGWIQLGLADYEAALLSFDRAREAAPANGLVQLFVGVALTARGEYPLAAAAFEEAYRLDPSLVAYGWDPVAHFGSAERYLAVVEQLAEYRSAAPTNSDGWLVTAWLELLAAPNDGDDLAPVKRAAGELVLYGHSSPLALALLEEVSRREQKQPLPNDFPLRLRLDSWLLAPSCDGVPGLEL
ncbi:MAG: hypothetical protein AAF581_16190 [Planctomycetota bacterium]